jgi:type IV pilus assembly protein PilA
MFCSQCGAAIPDTSRFCDHCGQPVPGQSTPQQSQAAAQAPISPPPAPYLVAEQTSGKALASMITGIFGLLFFLPAIAAIILGHISRSEIRKSNGRLKGNGMATAGLVMGYGMIAMIPFILIIAAIAIPNLLRARMAANEASAVASLRTINTAEISYASTYPTVGCAPTLAALGGTNCAPPDKTSACLIDAQLASGQKSGYRFELRNCTHSETDGDKYQVVAYPAVRNQTGVRIFCSDESGVIKVGEGESAEECLANGSPL